MQMIAGDMEELEERLRRLRMMYESAPATTSIPYVAPINRIGAENQFTGYDNRMNIDGIRGANKGAYGDNASFLAGMMYMKGLTDGMKMAKVYGEGASDLDGIAYDPKAIMDSYGKEDSVYEAYGSKGASYGEAGLGGKTGYARAGKGSYSSGGKAGSSEGSSGSSGSGSGSSGSGSGSSGGK